MPPDGLGGPSYQNVQLVLAQALVDPCRQIEYGRRARYIGGSGKENEAPMVYVFVCLIYFGTI
jgi:hypothetical protein